MAIQNKTILMTLIQLIAPLTTLVYGIWFIASIDKRIALLSSRSEYVQFQFKEFQDSQIKLNDAQDRQFHTATQKFDFKFNQLQDKIDTIYYRAGECNGQTQKKI